MGAYGIVKARVVVYIAYRKSFGIDGYASRPVGNYISKGYIARGIGGKAKIASICSYVYIAQREVSRVFIV